MVYRLDHRLVFPPPEKADEDGLLAVGGDLRPARLLLGYANGIFPWYHDGLPILWHSPDPRMVLRVEDLVVSRSLRKTLRKAVFEVRLDTAFADVVEACASVPRPDQEGTWITEEMKRAYRDLHRLGFAHSAEAWRDGRLAGGLYGVCLGGVFYGESMFARVPEASKVAFVTLVAQLRRWDVRLVDCQVHTGHLARFGATEWPRARFLSALRKAVRRPTREGRWALDQDLSRGLRPELPAAELR